jgi:Zn-dependent protease
MQEVPPAGPDEPTFPDATLVSPETSTQPRYENAPAQDTHATTPEVATATPPAPVGWPGQPQTWSGLPAPFPSTPQGQPVGRQQRGKRGGIATGAAGGAGLLVKILAGAKAFGLLALKFKVLLSMVVSVAAYSLFWGWKFAVGLVLLLLVHECGHVVVLRAQGIKASAPMFIPFLGAFVKMKSQPRSVVQEAVSALAGPVVGLAASGGVFLVAESTGSAFLRALAYTGFFLNLFNLLPTLPLDGGRVAGALHPAFWFAGLAGAVIVLIYIPSPIIFFVLLIGAGEAWRRWRAYRAGRDGGYHSVATSTRWAIASGYVACAALCLLGMATTFTSMTL